VINFQYRKMNESERHYTLKQIAKYFLFKNGYNCVAEEVYMFSANELGNKDITDTLGIKMRNVYNNGLKGYDQLKFDCMSIESKQSKQDYYNSFVSSADYNYVICPKGMLSDKDKFVEGVGLIEVDLDGFEFNRDCNGKINSKEPFLCGFEVKKKAKRNKSKNYYLKEDCQKINLLRQVAYRNTVETLFIRHGIKE